MKRNNAFYYLLALCFTATVQGCSDDENEIIIEEEETVEWVRPTEDEIRTHISKTALLLGKFDEVTERLIARIDMPQYGNTSRSGDFIPDNAELIIMDNSSLLSLSMEQVEELHQAYQDGATIYLHKPNAFGAAFFYAAMMDGPDALLGDSRAAADDDSWLYPYDVVAMHRDKGMMYLADAYSAEPQTNTVIEEEIDDETGEIISTQEKEVTTYQEEPTDYGFGLTAESIAKWINKDAGRAARTRASDEEILNEVPHEILIPTTYYYPQDINENTVKKVEGNTAIFRYWVSNLYNFEADQDYYHIVAQVEYDARGIYKGVYHTSDGWGAYNNKIMGNVYDGFNINFKLKEKDKYPLISQWNEQPINEGKVTTTESVQGWEIGAEVGYNNGLVGSLNASYSSQTTVSTVENEIKVTFEKGSLDSRTPSLYWHFDLGGNESMYFEGWSQPKVGNSPSEDALCRNFSRPMLSWNWVVGNTKNADALSVDMELRLNGISHSAKPTGFSVEKWYTTRWMGKQGGFLLQLPQPNRFRHDYSVRMAIPISDPNEWNSIVPILRMQSKTLAMYMDGVSLCGKSEDDLYHRTKDDWNNILRELKNLKFESLKHEYALELFDETGKPAKAFKNKQLLISKDGIYFVAWSSEWDSKN